MDTAQIVQNIITLTKQETALELKAAFAEVVHKTFDVQTPTIFEIHEIRDSESEERKNSEIAIDSLDYGSSFVYLEDIEGMIKSAVRGETVSVPDGQRYRLFFPVIEQEKITHIVALETIPEASHVALLEQLVSVFSNNLHLLNVKDRDHLTNFYNRQAYNRMINPILFDSRRKEVFIEQRKNFSFLGILDIDHFKAVNDTYGHLIGDEVLILFSQIMTNTFRHDDLLFRYGGEEFVIVIKDVDFQYVRSVFERCRKNVAAFEFPQVGRVTVSIGYTSISGARDPLSVLDKADRALYYCKQQGRNMSSFYEDLVRNQKIEPIIETNQGVEFWD